MNKKIFTSDKVYIYCAILIMIALSVTAYINWNDIKTTFFDIKLAEICQIFINISLAFYIGLHLNLRIKNIEQKKLLFLDLLNELQKTIKTIYKLGNDYIESNDRIKMLTISKGEVDYSEYIKIEQNFFEKLKDFSFNLSFVKETFVKETLKKDGSYNLIVDKIKKDYWVFKAELTGSKSSEPIDNAYRSIIKNIKKLKLKIYE
jgi:hypothetical protein